MEQPTFADLEYEGKKGKTRRELFLERVDGLIPWQRLEQHGLGHGLFKEINRHLESQGLRLREGTFVDASIIVAPSSSKNWTGQRDPEIHETKPGNQWHFRMKAHLGTDADTGIVHSMTATPAIRG